MLYRTRWHRKCLPAQYSTAWAVFTNQNQTGGKKNKGRVQKKHMSLFFEAHASLWRDPGCRRGSTFDSREYMSFILNHDHGMEENKFFFPLVFFARVKILRG
jgi:hypothetical protein